MCKTSKVRYASNISITSVLVMLIRHFKVTCVTYLHIQNVYFISPLYHMSDIKCMHWCHFPMWTRWNMLPLSGKTLSKMSAFIRRIKGTWTKTCNYFLQLHSDLYDYLTTYKWTRCSWTLKFCTKLRFSVLYPYLLLSVLPLNFAFTWESDNACIPSIVARSPSWFHLLHSVNFQQSHF